MERAFIHRQTHIFMIHLCINKKVASWILVVKSKHWQERKYPITLAGGNMLCFKWDLVA